jgi:hypothetical protein
VPIVLKSGSLNLLEPYGPVQACNGTALPFYCIAVHVKADLEMTKVYMLDTTKYVQNCLNLCLEFANDVHSMTYFEVILCVRSVVETSPQTVVTLGE